MDTRNTQGRELVMNEVWLRQQDEYQDEDMGEAAAVNMGAVGMEVMAQEEVDQVDLEGQEGIEGMAQGEMEQVAREGQEIMSGNHNDRADGEERGENGATHKTGSRWIWWKRR